MWGKQEPLVEDRWAYGLFDGHMDVIFVKNCYKLPFSAPKVNTYGFLQKNIHKKSIKVIYGKKHV